MTEFTREQVNIEKGQVLALLRWVAATAFTGRAIFRRGAQSSSLFFQEGVIIHARTNNPELRLGDILQRSQGLSPEALQRALKTSRARNQFLGMSLLEEKLVSPRDLYEGLVEQVELVAREAVSWDMGTCFLTPGVGPDQGVIPLRVPVGRVTGPPAGRAETPSAPEPALEDAAPRAAVREASTPAPAAPRADEPVLIFLREKEALADSELYGLLGAKPTYTQDELRVAYHSLVRAFHPDRFARRLSSEDMGRLEKVFARINAAFAVLGDLRRRKEFDQAGKTVRVEKKAPAPPPPQIEARRLHDLAVGEMQSGNYAQAIDYLKRATVLDPGQARLHFLLGKAYTNTGRHLKQAEDQLLQAIELDGSKPAYYILLGKIYKAGRLYGKALDMFNRALIWDPANREAREEKRSVERL